MKRILLLTLVVALALTVLCSCKVPEGNLSSVPSGDVTNSDVEDVHGELYGLIAETLDGEECVVTGAGLTMVNVWATWCTPCVKELPELDELSKEYSPQELRVIGILSDSEDEGALEDADKILQDNNISYIQLRATGELKTKLLDKNDISALPTTFFIDENGNIVDIVVGAKTLDEWKAVVTDCLSK